MPSQGPKRADRINEALVRTVAHVLITKARDPRVQNLTITAAKVADDMKLARIYFTLGGMQTQQMSELELKKLVASATKGLEKASGFIKRAIAVELQLRHIPDLIFTFDESFVKGARIEALLHQLRDSDPSNP